MELCDYVGSVFRNGTGTEVAVRNILGVHDCGEKESREVNRVDRLVAAGEIGSRGGGESTGELNEKDELG